MIIHLYDRIQLDNKNRLSIRATMWIDLKNTMLSQRSKAPQMTYYMIPFIRNSKGGKSNLHDKKQIRGCLRWDWRGGKGGHKELSVDGNVLYLDCGGGYGWVCVFVSSVFETFE